MAAKRRSFELIDLRFVKRTRNIGIRLYTTEFCRLKETIIPIKKGEL